MKFLADSYRKNGSLHHAYLIVGERVGILSELVAFIEADLGIATHGNPDFWHGSHDSFGIDEGRAVKETQEMRALGGGRKIFIIAANTMTEPAQNSLLKVFEEPTPDTHFFLIMPSAEGLLPTLRSRVQIIAHTGAGESEARKNAAAFLRATKAERLTTAKKMAEEISDEEATRTDALGFVREIEKLVRERSGEKLSREAAAQLEEILKIEDYLGDRSASVKMLLEHLALLL